jgi:hypothetical protein
MTVEYESHKTALARFTISPVQKKHQKTLELDGRR